MATNDGNPQRTINDLTRTVEHMTRVALSGSERDGCEDECRALLAGIAALGILAQREAKS